MFMVMALSTESFGLGLLRWTQQGPLEGQRGDGAGRGECS